MLAARHECFLIKHVAEMKHLRMIKLSDDALVLPLKIIIINCLQRSLLPEIWKYANMVPVHKKN